MIFKLSILLIAGIMSSCQLKEDKTSKMDTNKDTNNAVLASQETTGQPKPKVPFPLSTGYTSEYMKATFWKCNYNSAGPEHAYWVILPNTIKPTDIEPKKLSQVGLTSIGVYNTIDKTLPYIEVWVGYETVNSGQGPTEWMLNKLHITGEEVLNKNIINYPDGSKNLDVLTFKTTSNGEKIISRFTGMSKGQNYYILKASASEKDYNTQANTIFHIVSHWSLK